MPQFDSPEDVIESFRQACQANNTMAQNGHAIAAAVEKLQQIASEPDGVNAAAMCTDLVIQLDEPEIGAAAANLLYLRDNGHDLACAAGREIMKAQFDGETVDPTAFLRDRSGMNGFTAAAINNTAVDYETGMQARITEMANRREVLAYQPREDTSAMGLTPEERAVAVQMGTECLDLMTGAGLSPESMQYLNGVSNVANGPEAAAAIARSTKAEGPLLAAQQDKLAKAIVNNSTTLRVVGPRLATESQRSPALEGNAIWDAAVRSAQKTFNLPLADTAAETRFTQGMQAAVHTPENRQKVGAFHATVRACPDNTGVAADLSQVVAALKEEGKWELDGPAIEEMDIQAKALARQQATEVTVQAPAVAAEQPNQSRTQSIRDALRSAKEHLKSALHLDDEHKKNRAEKQLTKREAHLENLQERKAAVQQQLNDPAVQAALAKNPDPMAFVSGNQQARAGQQDLMDARDLQRQAAKLDQRIERNERKVASKQQEIERLQTKIDLRQNLQQGHAVQPAGRNRVG